MLDANSDNIVFASPNEFGQNEQITFQGFNLEGNSNESKFGVKLGDQTMTLKQFKLTIDGKDTVALDGFNLVSKFGEQGSSNIGGQIDYTMDALKVQGNDFGAGKLALKIDNVDGKALKDFADSYNRQTMALLQQGENLIRPCMSSKTPNCCKEPAAAAERQPEPQHRTAELEKQQGREHLHAGSGAD